MKVRLYRKSDYDELRLLIKAFHDETAGNPDLKDFYNKDNLKRDYVTIIAEDKGVIGFAIGKALNSNDFLLLDAFVVKEFRRKGLGVKLFKKLFSVAEKRGCKRLLANPVKDESLRLLVKKFGFRELPDSDKNAPGKGSPPHYTYFLDL